MIVRVLDRLAARGAGNAGTQEAGTFLTAGGRGHAPMIARASMMA